MSNPELTFPDMDKKPIGGWLYLVAFGVFIGPVVTAVTFLNNYLPLFSNGSWSNATSPDGSKYHPMYASQISLELFFLAVLICLQVLAVFLFIKRSRDFPKVYIFLLAFSAIGAFAAALKLSILPGITPELLKESNKSLVRSIAAAAIWIPYSLKSIRVRETFNLQTPTFAQPFVSLRVLSTPFAVLFLIFFWKLSVSDNQPGNRTSAVVKYTDSPSSEAPATKTDSNSIVNNEQTLNSKQIADISLSNLVVVEPLNLSGKAIGIGSGFFIMKNVIVTNYHVVKNAKKIRVRKPNSIKMEDQARVIAVDPNTDLALVETIDLSSDVPLKLGNSSQSTVGSQVYVSGNPQGLEGTFSDGLVSNKQRMSGIEVIQISAPISPGSSGGPVVDASGKAIGVATSYFKSGQNLNIAVPSTYIARLILRTEEFYPIAENPDLVLNPTIEQLFPSVCSELVDVNLPTQYFIEIPEADLKSPDFASICEGTLPTCKRAWYTKDRESLVLVGALPLGSVGFKDLSRNEFEKAVDTISRKMKEGYRSTDENTKFQITMNDLNSNTIRVDFKAEYSSDGEAATDFRTTYFVLPYCRLDVALSTKSKTPLAEEGINEILKKSFTRVLPGVTGTKALFKFNK